MGTNNGRVLAALSLAALASLTACLDSAGTDDTEVGTISIGLAGQGASGAIYRLRDATFTVDGPSSMLVWSTEDDPDRTSLSANVVIGNYTASLAPGWRMERLVMGQPPVDVNATLVSTNPAMFAISLGGFALLGWLSTQAWFYTGLGVQPALAAPNDALALLLFMLVVPVFGFFVSPLFAQLSRKHEFEADAYACAQADGRDLAAALLKLHEDNASTLTPDPLYVRFYYSHPPAGERLAALPPSPSHPAG